MPLERLARIAHPDPAKAAPMREDVTRPIVGIENRTAQEVFDIMADRFRLAHTARPDAGDEDVERVARGKFWLIVRKPGMVPDRKGPFQATDTAKVLREFMAANPDAFIDYLTVTPDGEPYVDHGPEVLQMADGRSMSVGRKHNERVKSAALAAMREGVGRGAADLVEGVPVRQLLDSMTEDYVRMMRSTLAAIESGENEPLMILRNQIRKKFAIAEAAAKGPETA